MKTNHLVIILVVISVLIFTGLLAGYGRNATDSSDTGDASVTPTVTPEDISRTSESKEITSPPEESTAVETEALTEEEITTEITQPEETETAEVTAEVETAEITEATETVETTVEQEPETTPVIEETTEEDETETIPPVEETTEVIPEETTTEFKEPTVEPAVTETEETIPIPPEKEHPKEEEITTKAENEYKPLETGDNPFAGGGKTEVKDNPSDDYIGEGERLPNAESASSNAVMRDICFRLSLLNTRLGYLVKLGEDNYCSSTESITSDNLHRCRLSITTLHEGG